MKEDEIDDISEKIDDASTGAEAHSTYVVPKDKSKHLSGMFQNWFLDYASYVILERAVPHIQDGLKPVQRRILHTMKELDDGRFNKVANIVGSTMQYHPHGDASIGDALVQLGQKELLVDTQGNWGNILTGDSAAAPRYIEARLSEFAIETVYNPKTTDWTVSYDGRKPEPVTLPVKYPLLLAQGAEGIAVGLSSKILPHNFVEILDAAIAYLRGEEFALYPDFPTGGFIDVSKYNDGERGGSVRVRAKIEKIDNKTLEITDVPFGRTSGSVIETIIKAQEKGKIKIKRVDDNTAKHADIIVHLLPGTSSDRTIDALYAFTDCEVSISPNCCVISDRKPHFLSVSDVLRHSVDTTKHLLQRELEIQRGELRESLLYASLEKIFIEERIYKDKEYEQSKSVDEAVAHIDKRLEPFKPSFVRDVTRDDILKLLEIKMKRILKFNADSADTYIQSLKDHIDVINDKLTRMVEVTIDWYKHLKDKYGAHYPRRTVIRSFDNIEATRVAEANEKLYINREDGFIGTGLKKDEFVCNCSDIDDIVVFFRDGKYRVVRVADKIFVGKNVLWVGVYNRNDRRTTYNAVYRDGQNGPVYIKRFNLPSVMRDRDYDLTRGEKGSRVLYFTANPNGEAEVIKVTLEANPKLRKIFIERDFSEVPIKGRSARGLLVTRNPVHRVGLKSHGHSTLGGRKVWFDPDVNRINYDDHGRLLGEFNEDDAILVILEGGEFYISNFDANNHYEDNIARIEKWDPKKVWTAVVNDADNGGFAYIKRFTMDALRRHQNFVGENEKNQLVLLTDTFYPRLLFSFGGTDADRAPLEIDADSFIGVKGFKAKGKRVTTFNIDKVEELEPLRQPDPEPEPTDAADEAEPEDLDPDAGKSQQQVIDEMTGQLNLFTENADL